MKIWNLKKINFSTGTLKNTILTNKLNCMSQILLCHWYEHVHGMVPSERRDVTWCRLVVGYRCFGVNLLVPNPGVKQSSHSSWTAWPLKMGMIGCPSTSVTDYQPMDITSPKSEGLNYTTQKPEILPVHNKRIDTEQLNTTKCIKQNDIT